MKMKYLRFSMLVGVPEERAGEEVANDVVSNDLRDVIQGDLDPDDIPYRMIVSVIEFKGDETK